MAKINEISVEVARTYNMGNYESLKIPRRLKTETILTK